MKRKYIHTPCHGCIWNNQPKCGKPFCILPRCVERNGLLQSNANELNVSRSERDKKGGTS